MYRTQLGPDDDDDDDDADVFCSQRSLCQGDKMHQDGNLFSEAREGKTKKGEPVMSQLLPQKGLLLLLDLTLNGNRNVASLTKKKKVFQFFCLRLERPRSQLFFILLLSNYKVIILEP